MSLTISREQRDAIYQVLVDHLSGIGDIWIELEKHELPTAQRLAREYVEELHLLSDIGWDQTIDADTVTLTRPVDELIRTLFRLHKAAAGALGAYVARPRDEDDRARQDLFATTALVDVLRQLADLARAGESDADAADREDSA